jgi:hypothetical protein
MKNHETRLAMIYLFAQVSLSARGRHNDRMLEVVAPCLPLKGQGRQVLYTKSTKCISSVTPSSISLELSAPSDDNISESTPNLWYWMVLGCIGLLTVGHVRPQMRPAQSASRTTALVDNPFNLLNIYTYIYNCIYIIWRKMEVNPRESFTDSQFHSFPARSSDIPLKARGIWQRSPRNCK